MLPEFCVGTEVSPGEDDDVPPGWYIDHTNRPGTTKHRPAQLQQQGLLVGETLRLGIITKYRENTFINQ